MKILALPRDRNPYQRLLYEELERLGCQVRYIGDATPSRTLNLLLLPVQVMAGRIAGARVVHLHWVFCFALPLSDRFPVLRRLAQVWFQFWLSLVRLLDMRLVWTAHNVLPHSQVFADDVAARKRLVDHSDLVFVHSVSVLAELSALGAEPKRSVAIRHPPLGSGAEVPLRVPPSDERPREFLFFGNVTEYKGVEELLAAYCALPAQIHAGLTIAGQCADPELRTRLAATRSLRLRLERIPEDEIAELMTGTDVVVLPFRRVTTSGSAVLALAHGKPLIVPELPGLSELPAEAVTRYDGSIDGLTAALVKLARADPSRLTAMSAAALSWSRQASWKDVASTTLTAMKAVVGGQDPHLRPPQGGRNCEAATLVAGLEWASAYRGPALLSCSHGGSRRGSAAACRQRRV
jgi:glycosyltransferase involved in cell wall biosynthesis